MEFEIEQKNSYICLLIKRGCPLIRAEIIPKLPDPDNAGGGNKDHTKVIIGIFHILNPLFYLTI